MPTKPLSQIALFKMHRENLQKRIVKFYEESQDADSVIQYLIAVLIRQCLCISDFSDFCSELVREIFLSAEPSDMLRKACPLFRGYFSSGKEWEQVTRRLYKNRNEYHRYNNRLSDCKKYIFSKTTPIEETDGQQYKIISTFEDAVGKLHTWSLQDADKHSSSIKIDAVLELMSTLTIFEKDGIRRFVKLENSDIMNCTRYPKIRKGEVLKEIEAETQPKAEMTALTKVDVNTMSEQEKLEFVKQLLPEGIVLTDTRMAQLEQEKEENSAPDTESSAVSTNDQANGASQAAVKEPPAKKKSSMPRPMALSAEKSPSMNYKKPKSAKQKKREKNDELMKRTKEGKRNSRKRKKRK